MKSEKGQSLVEFALILPLLLVLLFGIVDFGRALHAYLTIDHAGREAARAASIGGKSNQEIKDIAKAKAVGLGITDGNVSISPETRISGDDVTITITYTFNFITPINPIIKLVLKEEDDGDKGTIPLANTTVMRVE